MVRQRIEPNRLSSQYGRHLVNFTSELRLKPKLMISLNCFQTAVLVHLLHLLCLQLVKSWNTTNNAI